MSTDYREARRSDILFLARIRAVSWGADEYWRYRIAGYLDGSTNPQHALKPRVLCIASDSNVPIGFIAGHLTRRFQCQGELEWIDVLPAHRGQGIALELLRLLARWFVKDDAITVCVDVVPDNTIARSFYARHGARDLQSSWMVWADIRIALTV